MSILLHSIMCILHSMMCWLYLHFFPSLLVHRSLRMKMACIFFYIENRLYVVILIVGAFMGAEGKKHAETSVILFLCLIYCPEPEPSI